MVWADRMGETAPAIECKIKAQEEIKKTGSIDDAVDDDLHKALFHLNMCAMLS